MTSKQILNTNRDIEKYQLVLQAMEFRAARQPHNRVEGGRHGTGAHCGVCNLFLFIIIIIFFEIQVGIFGDLKSTKEKFRFSFQHWRAIGLGFGHLVFF